MNSSVDEDFNLNPFDNDKFQEECGVVGIYGIHDAATLVALGLHALQHRGQEAAGIVTYNAQGSCFNKHVAFGKVGEIFSTQEVMEALPGECGIGHNRYSTSGTKKNINNIQPLFAELSSGNVALAHNGNLTNANSLRKKLVNKGSIFQTSMDTETIVHLIATSHEDNIVDSLIDAMGSIKGGYALVTLTEDALIGARDPLGVRPLSLAKLDGGYVLASESCAFDIIGAEFIRDIDPGEIVVIDEKGIKSLKPFNPPSPRFCIFEYVYFSRPDSYLEGKDVYSIRKMMGRELAKECDVDVDVVIPVPDSGVPAAIGFSEQSGIPFELGIIRNHYVGRTFIEPTDTIRHLGVKLKHNANMSVIKGKKVLLIDDSIVRGTTSKKIVDMVRAAGAKEVHMRISSPPTTDPCFYGVDTPSKDKLLASKMSIEEMCTFINADSLGFLSTNSLYVSLGEAQRNEAAPQYCDACFTGDYPISIEDKISA